MAQNAASRAQQDFDDLPPLEDLSEALKQASSSIANRAPLQCSPKTIAEPTQYLEVHSSGDAERFKTVEKLLDAHTPKISEKSSKYLPEKQVNYDKNNPEKAQPTSGSSGSFCGFAKGFLTSKQSTRPPAKKSPVDDEPLTVICSQPNTTPKHVLPEVQQSLKQGNPLLSSKEWITDDLLKRIEDNPKLAKQLEDPRFSQALSAFQTDPELANALLKKNPELGEFLTQFAGLIGEHFTALGEQKSGKKSRAASESKTVANDRSSSEETAVKTILQDPTIKALLNDEQVKQVIATLKCNPREGSRILHTADPALRLKLQRLLDAGLLGVSTG